MRTNIRAELSEAAEARGSGEELTWEPAGLGGGCLSSALTHRLDESPCFSELVGKMRQGDVRIR